MIPVSLFYYNFIGNTYTKFTRRFIRPNTEQNTEQALQIKSR